MTASIDRETLVFAITACEVRAEDLVDQARKESDRESKKALQLLAGKYLTTAERLEDVRFQVGASGPQ